MSTLPSKLAAVVCLCLLALRGVAAQFVELAGDIETIGWSGSEAAGKTNAKPRTFSFVCIVGTNEWRMENDLSEYAEEKWFFDGTNVYNSVRVTRALPEEKRQRFTETTRLATVPFERAKSNLTIRIWPSRDGHPLGDYGVNIPWLAFCSGTYLKRTNRLIPLPAAILRHTRDRFAYTDRTTTFKDGFGLPQSVDLFTSKALLETSENDFDQEYSFGNRYAEWKKKIVSELEEGVQTFHYAVIASTNFLGWNFPTRFEFHQNGRKYEQNGDWYCRGTGRVESIRIAARPSGLFMEGQQQTIADWRFRDSVARVTGITYTTTNAFASPTNDAVLQEKFQKQVDRALRMEKSPK